MADKEDKQIKKSLVAIRAAELKILKRSARATTFRESRETLVTLTNNKKNIDLSLNDINNFPQNLNEFNDFFKLNDLFPNSLEDEDLNNLGNILKNNTTTTTLNLAKNSNITSKGLDMLLKALEKNMTLRTINLDDTKLTTKTKENFQRKLAEKFAPKKPGFFRRIWQSIFGKPKAQKDEILPPEEAILSVIVPPGGAPAAEAIAAGKPMAPPPPASEPAAPVPEAQAISDLLSQLSQDNIIIDEEAVIELGYICSISAEIMKDPVRTSDGQTYDRIFIEKWLTKNNTSPATRKELENKNLTPDLEMRTKIVGYLKSLKKEHKPPHP